MIIKSKTVFLEKMDDLFDILKTIPGAQSAHGECSFGYSFELKDGSFLTIGRTDDDVSDPHLMWFEHHKPNNSV